MKTVKVGSVGLGRLGYEHAKNLATQVPGCELAAICDVDANRVKEVAAELGVPNTYTDFEEMCKNPELDAIVIVSPSFLHCQQIEIAMNHGKHVFCEKPLGTDVAQCKAAEKVIEAHPDLIFQLGFMRRFDKSYAEAKRKIDNGDIGKVVLFAPTRRTRVPPSSLPSSLHRTPAVSTSICVYMISTSSAGSPARMSRMYGQSAAYSSSTCTRS